MDLNIAAVVLMGGYVLAIIAAGLFMALRPSGRTVTLAATPEPASELPVRRDEILLGSEAEAFGNPRGRVQGVLVAPESLQIQALALSAGLGLLEDRLVPAAAILSADGHAVHLAEHWTEPGSDGSPPTAVSLRRDAAVLSAEGKRLGRLRVVCFDRDTRAVTSLGAAGRRSSPSLRLLPIERVKQAGGTAIVTELKAAEWQSLNPYASDWTISQTVLERLAADPVLRPFQRSLGVDVRDQHVRLSGYVTDGGQADRVMQLARSVPGVLRVDQGIICDEDLNLAVGQALRKDPRTVAADVQVSSRLGRVEITGQAPNPAAVRAIDDVASQVPGVLVVHNLTTVGRGV